MKIYNKIIIISGLFILSTQIFAKKKEPKTVFQVSDAWSSVKFENKSDRIQVNLKW